MKWDEMRRSDNVEDVRGSSPIGRRGAGIGLGSLAIALVASAVFGVNPITVLNIMQGISSAPTESVQQQPTQNGIDDQESKFVKAVLGDTEDTWSTIFQQQVRTSYQPPRLVLFRDGVDSACGTARTASGPFYCPPNQKVYLDMGFFQQIEATAGSNADFARSYAIAHEVGHHVQNQLGISSKVRQAQAQSSKSEANALSVLQELQADCFAGIWGHHTAERGLIGSRDVEGAMTAAAQIGDDYLQKRSQGYVVPEAFTHGSSKERVRWFNKGMQSGSIQQCDTFTAAGL
jgi:uncharacterized protein